MILGWRKNPVGESYYLGKVKGADRKFIRLLCGVVLPIFDRPRGVVIVVAESYRPSAPMDLVALAAKAGPWGEIEATLVKYRRDLKFDHIVTDTAEARYMIRRIPGLNYGEIPLLINTAPKTGRQRVDSLVSEGRLHLDTIQRILDAEGELGLKALSAAVTWASEHPAVYQPKRKQQPEGRPLGTVGL